MAKETAFTITGTDLYKGMQDSQYLGVADIRNIDITSTPGIAKIANRLVKESGSIVTNLIKFWDIDPRTGNVYAVDNAGQALKRVAGNWSTISGYTGSSVLGVKIWHDYLFVTGNSGSTTAVQTYGPLSTTPTWTAFKTVNTTTTNLNAPMYIGKNDVLYFASNQYIGQLSEVSGQVFDPSNSGTYVFSQATASASKLLLASEYNIVSLAQAGLRMYVGPQRLSPTGSKIPLFPWDLVSSLPDVPITIGQSGIQNLVESNSLIYVNAGTSGNISVTNGASTQEIKRLTTWNMSPLDGLQTNPQAVDAWNNGIIYGFGKVGTADDTSPVGVYFYKDKGGKDKAWCYFIPSHGLDGTVGQTVQIGAVLTLSNTSFLVSWYDGTDYGVDVMDTSKCYTGYSAYFTSPLWQTNQVLDKTALTRIEFKFAKPLSVDQGLKIEYRESANDSWIQQGIWDFVTYGATRTGYFNFGYSKPQLQIKVSLTTNSVNNLSPELEYVTVF